MTRTHSRSDGFGGWTTGMSFEKMAEGFTAERPLTTELQQHLAKVYGTLLGGCVAAALGVAIYLQTHIGYMMPMLASFLSIMLLATTPKENVVNRLGYFGLICLSQGIMMGGLIEVALYVDPSLIGYALVATAMCFAGFTVAALQAEKRTMLYVGGVLYSTLGYLCLASFINLFFRTQILWNVQLYGGLLVFMGYISFDTFMMIEKFYAGDRDFISHSLELFLDLAAVFVRILIILLKDQENKRKRERKD